MITPCTFFQKVTQGPSGQNRVDDPTARKHEKITTEARRHREIFGFNIETVKPLIHETNIFF